jgi:surfeit locus 1 family protein
MRPRGRDWLLVAIALIVAGVCVRLGLWQLDRRAQRLTRNAALAEQLARPPVDIAGAGSVEMGGRRVSATGVYDWAREHVRPARPFDGTPGVAMLTPLVLADGRAVFVDRGWVPSPDGRRVDAARVREPDSATVVGIAFAAPRGRGDVEPARLADSLPYAVLPFVIQQTGDPVPGGPRRWPEPALGSGPHLAYAVQWFSFAVIAVVGTGVLLRKGGNRRQQAEPGGSVR